MMYLVLSGDVAANLQRQIDEIETSKVGKVENDKNFSMAIGDYVLEVITSSTTWVAPKAKNKRFRYWMTGGGGPADTTAVDFKSGNRTYSSHIQSGGGSGEVKTGEVFLDQGAQEEIVIGAGGSPKENRYTKPPVYGGSTTAFGKTARGGSGSCFNETDKLLIGGSGFAGGGAYRAGQSNGYYGRAGDGIYGGGGGGGGVMSNNIPVDPGKGGAYGGDGGGYYANPIKNGTPAKTADFEELLVATLMGCPPSFSGLSGANIIGDISSYAKIHGSGGYGGDGGVAEDYRSLSNPKQRPAAGGGGYFSDGGNAIGYQVTLNPNVSMTDESKFCAFIGIAGGGGYFGRGGDASCTVQSSEERNGQAIAGGGGLFGNGGGIGMVGGLPMPIAPKYGGGGASVYLPTYSSSSSIEKGADGAVFILYVKEDE